MSRMTTTETTIILSEAPEYLTPSEYAKRHGWNPRTVKRWLAAGELPGQYQDEKGWWQIPRDAEHTPNTGAAPTVASTSPPGAALAVFTGTTWDAPTLDRLPTFLPLEQASVVLGVSVHEISHDRKYYRVRKTGRALTVPLHRIKKLRGIR